MLRPIKSLDDLYSGAAAERFNIELDKVLKDIRDPNTNAKEKRKITMSLVATPRKDRNTADFSLLITTKLAGFAPIEQTVMLNQDDAGNVTATVIGDQLPGQLDMDEKLEPPPNTVDFSKYKNA